MLKKEDRYDNYTVFFHWLMVVLIFTLFGLGWYMVDIPKGTPERSWFFALHKSIGLTVAMLAVIRIAWRLTHTPPPLHQSFERWQTMLASATHYLLYCLMIIQPLSGYISSSFSGYKTKFWGVALPHWGWKDQHLNQLFTDIHVASSLALVGLIALHLCGAFSHLFLPHVNGLGRMQPSFERRSKKQNEKLVSETRS